MTTETTKATSGCKNCGEDIPLNHVQVGGVHMQCEQAYFHDKSIKMIKVRPPGCTWCVMSVIEAKGLIDELDDENGEEEALEFKVVFMSKGEIEALPEFTGW